MFFHEAHEGDNENGAFQFYITLVEFHASAFYPSKQHGRCCDLQKTFHSFSRSYQVLLPEFLLEVLLQAFLDSSVLGNFMFSLTIKTHEIQPLDSQVGYLVAPSFVVLLYFLGPYLPTNHRDLITLRLSVNIFHRGQTV